MAGSTDYATEAVDRLLPRIPATLYEVAWQYSLFDWYASMQSDDIDFDLSPKHLAYLTPRAKSELFGEPDSLVVVSVDLSNPDNPQLVENNGSPVKITTYTEADRFRVGHSFPGNRKTSGRTDYSITTHKEATAHHIAGRRDDAWGTNNIQDRFTEWPQSEYAESVIEEVDDEEAAVLEGLAKLGDNEAAMERLDESVINEAGGEEVELDTLITVRIRLREDGCFKFPAEIPVLNEVMVKKRESIAFESGSGSGAGYLRDRPEAEVTGTTSGLFGMYTLEQREHIPDLYPKSGPEWRNRPLEFEIALAVDTVDSVLNDFYRGLGNSRRLYILPYLACRPSECAPEDFTWFFESVFETLRDADSEGFDEQVETIMRLSRTADKADGSQFDDIGHDAWENVRIASVLMVSGNPDRVYFDMLDASYYPGTLEDAHNGVLDHAVFSVDGIFAGTPDPQYSPLLGTSLRLHRYILYGGYFDRTTEPTPSSQEASETPTAGDIDDYRMQRVGRVLTGQPLAVGDLLDHYLNKLVQEQRDAFGQDTEYTPIPTRSIVEQYTQLHALAAADLLQSTRDTSPTFTRQAMAASSADRDDRLEQFLDSHGALSESHHRATFLLGALVGRVTAYQSQEDISSTLVRRYPIDYLTKQTIKEVTKEVLQQDAEYAEADDRRSYWTNSRYTTRLSDTMLSTDPTSWPITDAELQWLYGLGMTYGLNDTGIEDDPTDAADEPTAETT